MKKLVRPIAGRKIAGVCLGIARYFSTDVTLVRVAFVILGLAGGAPGILLYIILWVALPEV